MSANPLCETASSRVELQLRGQKVRVNLINSAIFCQHRPGAASERETDQGRLFFPVHFFAQDYREPCNTSCYAITVLHHPENWFESNNSVELRHFIRNISDLVLTGHQHENDAKSEEAITSEMPCRESACATGRRGIFERLQFNSSGS